MIKEAVAMKLQKKCRDQLHISAIRFFLKIPWRNSPRWRFLNSTMLRKSVGPTSAQVFSKDFERFMLPEIDCQNYLVLFCRTFLNKLRQNGLGNLFAIS